MGRVAAGARPLFPRRKGFAIRGFGVCGRFVQGQSGSETRLVRGRQGRQWTMDLPRPGPLAPAPRWDGGCVSVAGQFDQSRQGAGRPGKEDYGSGVALNTDSAVGPSCCLTGPPTNIMLEASSYQVIMIRPIHKRRTGAGSGPQKRVADEKYACAEAIDCRTQAQSRFISRGANPT